MRHLANGKNNNDLQQACLINMPAALALWCKWLTYNIVNVETAGSYPVGVVAMISPL
jgi:hypothetical protein